jgi:hypothetical protein
MSRQAFLDPLGCLVIGYGGGRKTVVTQDTQVFCENIGLCAVRLLACMPERVNVVDGRQLGLVPIRLLLSRARRCANDKVRSTSRASRSCGAPFAGIIGLRCHSYRPLLRL